MGNKLRAFRHARRWRQRDLADQVEVMSRRVLNETLSVTERTISRWEGGDTPSLPAQRVIAAVFETTPEELGFPAPAPEVAVASGLGLGDGFAAPEPDAVDAFELVARLTRSDASDATLAMLARRVDLLCREYPVRRADELLAESRRWLDRTLAMTDRRLTLTQHRETLVQAGWLSALVACLTYDLGDASGAETWREATAQLGNETGHSELIGWSYEIAAWMALTSGRPADAAEYATVGEEIDGTSCVSVQLAAQRARALALAGDRVGAEAAMARGRATLAHLPAPADPDHHFVIDPAKADFYAVDVYRMLDMREAASEYAHRVLDYCERPDGSIRSPMRRSEALMTLGTVAARNGELDAAVAHGLNALGDSRKCLPSLLAVAADLNTELRQHNHEPVVGQWREALDAIRAPLTLES
ncbi:helix-turn-helix transcriptional regulator [Saccharopolyspora phatthalungensis]|uniref:Transcriptional regulator with XRE-family HTH domain n=1 Tax=Saccharopolyspora phatthalungensis TaxID=664693 RepID=A0A840QFB8_9PSEU|nr:helix-turn-helix transcriptional regulator [Saccharopolyspora phatthalungensis]MBB5155783.1 transcriptional regulator with XRE-family HTH domain [Saccharopolyspora phatthalungensis]